MQIEVELIERIKKAVIRIQALQPDKFNEKCLGFGLFNDEEARDLESWVAQLVLLQNISTDWDGRFPLDQKIKELDNE